MNKIIEEEKRYYKNNINCYNVFPDLDGSTISEKKTFPKGIRSASKYIEDNSITMDKCKY